MESLSAAVTWTNRIQCRSPSGPKVNSHGFTSWSGVSIAGQAPGEG